MKRTIGWLLLALSLPMMGAIAGCEEEAEMEEEESEVLEEEDEGLLEGEED